MMRAPHHTRLARTAAAGLTALFAACLPGCDSDFAKEFRQVAGPSIESGVSSILNGVLDGLFAVADPDDTSSDTTGDTGTTE